MNKEEHYLKRELYDLVQKDSAIFEFLQEGALDGIWYWDIEKPDIEWMSQRFWELFGVDHTTKEHLSSEWQDLINPDDLQEALTNFTKHCEDPNHPYDQVVRYRHTDGSTVWVRCRGIAIRDETGKAIRMLGAHNDITQLKQTEEQLTKKTTELEKANQKLQEALDQIKTLKGFLPICAACKKVRNDQGYWTQIESYIQENSEAELSHGICPDCAEKIYAGYGRPKKRYQ